jgi:imidazoleglycerol-phosphate dehydratase/histidinol-phosphatase
LKLGLRTVYERNTNETKIRVELNLDGSGKANINTGLDSLIICSIRLPVMENGSQHNGDLHIDEFTALKISHALAKRLKALADKRDWNDMALPYPWMKQKPKC